MSATISCAIWVFRAQEWPMLFKGLLAQAKSDNGERVTVSVSQVKKHTWEGYHGKLLPQDRPAEDVLWSAHGDLLFEDLLQADTEKPDELRFIGGDELRLVVQKITPIAA